MGRFTSILLVLALIAALAAARWRHRSALAAAPVSHASSPSSPAPLEPSDDPADIRRAPRPAGEQLASDGVPGRGRAVVAWSPSSEDAWSRARTSVDATLAPLDAQRALARAVPPLEPGPELGPSFGSYLSQPPGAAFAPYGGVERIADGVVRVVDGRPARGGWAQVELRLAPADDAPARAEVAVFGASADGALAAWSITGATLALESALSSTAGSLLVRYSIRARDGEDEERVVAGLVEIALP